MIHFTINAPRGSLTTSPVGPVPGGFRLQIGYGKAVKFWGNTSAGADYSGDMAKGAPGDAADDDVNGNVVTGSDWVLLRDDGVAIFNAKITFQAAFPGKHVFDAVLSGRVPLEEVGWGAPISTQQEWQTLNGTLHVSLPIQFETSQKEADVASDPESPLHGTATYADTFADLAKNQFVACGEIKVTNGLVEWARLDVSLIKEAKAQAKHDEQGQAAKSSLAERADPLMDLILRVNATTWLDVRDALVANVAAYIERQMGPYGVKEGELANLKNQPWEDANRVIGPIKTRFAEYELRKMGAERQAGNA